MKLKYFLLLILVIALLAFIKIKFFQNKGDKKSMGNQGKPPAIPVGVYVAKEEVLNNELFVTGTLIANESATLYPETNGKIIKLKLKEGETVKKGELIAKINDTELQVQLKKINLQTSLLKEKLERIKSLQKIGGTSQEELDNANNLLELNLAEAEIIKTQIQKTEVLAPFNGILGFKNISEGAIANTTTIIAEIQQLNPIKIEFSVPEKYSNVIGKNNKVFFKINENSKIYEAKVVAIDPKINTLERTLQIRAIADNSNLNFIPGSFAKINLPLKKIENALMIPTESIIPILKGKKVFICKNGKASEAIVTTGIRNADKIQILTGLSEGDSIVTMGMVQLKEGSEIKIVKTSYPTPLIK